MASSSTNTTTSKKLILRSSDGEVFEVEEGVASLSVLIKNSIEDSDNCADTIIPLPNVNARELAKVMEYCRKHSASCSVASTSSSNGKEEGEELKNFDSELVKDYDFEELFSLAMPSNNVNVPNLTSLLCQVIADRIKDKTPEEVREIFNVEKNEFTPEEEEQFRNENKWAFD